MVTQIILKYRSRREIISAILVSIGNGNSKTRIMRDACLTYVQIMEYLSALERNKMIEYQDTNMAYRMTGKGRKLLADCGRTNGRRVPASGRILEKLY